jgi:hypothetical protein
MFDIVLDDILEVKFWYTAGNDRALNVRHYQVTAVSVGAGPLTSLSAANQLQTNFSLALTNAMSIDATFDAVSVQRLTPLPKTVATFSTGAAVPGAELTAVLPRQVAGLVSLYSAFAGPRNRGRFYMPYPAEIANDVGGVPTAAYQVLLGVVRDEVVQTQVLNNTVGNSTLTPVIVHRDGGVVTFITSGVSRSAWATQRRRQNARF